MPNTTRLSPFALKVCKFLFDASRDLGTGQVVCDETGEAFSPIRVPQQQEKISAYGIAYTKLDRVTLYISAKNSGSLLFSVSLLNNGIPTIQYIAPVTTSIL